MEGNKLLQERDGHVLKRHRMPGHKVLPFFQIYFPIFLPISLFKSLQILLRYQSPTFKQLIKRITFKTLTITINDN